METETRMPDVSIPAVARWRAANLIQAVTRRQRRRRHAKQAALRHATAAICVQRHVRRWAGRAVADRPFVLRLRRQLVVLMLTPLVWLVWMIAVSRSVPFFWPRAVLGFPLLVTDALSINAYLQLGPAWCRGEFLAKLGVDPKTLGLRASVIVAPLIILADLAQQASSSPESVRENAEFFLEVSKGHGSSVGVLVGVMPALRGRYFYIGLCTLWMAVHYLRLWNVVDGGAVVLLAPALLCALCGHLSHITVAAALRHTVGREEVMGDLRRMLDADGGAVKELVDTADITLKWTQGPLAAIYKWGILVGLVCHACDVVTACWAHGCYAMDEPSILCVRYVLAVLALSVVWLPLVHSSDAVRGHEICLVVALAHTFYAGGCIAATLGEASFQIAAAPKCEATLSGVPAPLEGPLGLFALQEPHAVIRVCRNLVLSFLATAQPTTELHRGLNVALTIGCVVLSEPNASPWADVRVVASVFSALLTYMGLHALGASWQREHVVAQLEMRRREQLTGLTVSHLRRAIDAEQVHIKSVSDRRRVIDAEQQQSKPADPERLPESEQQQRKPAELLPETCPPPGWLVHDWPETAPPAEHLMGLRLIRGSSRSSRHSSFSSHKSSRPSCSSPLASIHEPDESAGRFSG